MPPKAALEYQTLAIPWIFEAGEERLPRQTSNIDRLLKKSLPISVRKEFRTRSLSAKTTPGVVPQQRINETDLDISFCILVSPEAGISPQWLSKRIPTSFSHSANNKFEDIFDGLFEDCNVDDQSSNTSKFSEEHSLASGWSGLSSGAVISSSSIPKTHRHVALCARYFQRGRLHLQNQRDALAMKCFRSALDMNRKMFGDFHQRNVTMLVDVGDTFLEERGNIRKSLKFYQAALEVTRQCLGELHPDLAMLLNKVGQIYTTRAEYDKAIMHFNESLTLKDEVDGAISPISIKNQLMLHKADAVFGIGKVYFYRGEYAMALEHYNIALHAQRRHLSPTDEKVATIIHHIGILNASTGHINEAFSHGLEALRMRRLELGDSHKSIGESLNSIASICIIEGNYEKAFPVLKEALKIQQNAPGHVNIDVARTLNNIGIACTGRGKANYSIKFFINAVKIVENTVRKNHPFIGDILANLGDAYSLCDDYEGALGSFNRSLHIYQVNKVPEFHPCVVKTRESLSSTEYKLECSC